MAGQVLFRNTRDALKGFPVRKALPCPIELREGISAEEMEERLLLEYESDDSEEVTSVLDYQKGSRIHWLAELLRELSDEKGIVDLPKSGEGTCDTRGSGRADQGKGGGVS